MNAIAKTTAASRHGDLTSPAYWDGLWSLPTEAPDHRRLGTRSRFRRQFDAVLTSFLDGVGREPADVLEVGCAPGLMLARMHGLRSQHRYHGVDYAPAGVAATRDLLGRRGILGEIHHADLREFAPPRKYDLVASFGLVEHFPEPGPIFAAHARLCKAGGMVAVTVPNYASPPVKWLIERLDPAALEVHCLEIMRPEAIRRRLEEAGLVDVRCGQAGTASVRTACPRPTLLRRGYRMLGRGWNALAATLALEWPWCGVIWGMGRAPAGG